MTKIIQDGWGIYDRAGVLRFVCLRQTENDAWQSWLGYPSEEEIEENRRQGFHCEAVSIEPKDYKRFTS